MVVILITLGRTGKGGWHEKEAGREDSKPRARGPGRGATRHPRGCQEGSLRRENEKDLPMPCVWRRGRYRTVRNALLGLPAAEDQRLAGYRAAGSDVGIVHPLDWFQQLSFRASW